MKITIYEFYTSFTSNIWFIFIYFESFKRLSIFFYHVFLNYALHINNQYFCFLWFPKHPHLNCFLIYFAIFLLSGFIFFVCFWCFVWFFCFFLWFVCFLGKHNWRGSLNCKRKLTWSLFSFSQLNNDPTVLSGVDYLSRRQSIANSCYVSLNLYRVCLKLLRPKKEQKFKEAKNSAKLCNVSCTQHIWEDDFFSLTEISFHGRKI